MENGQFVDRVCVKRCHMKKKIEGRTVPLHSEAKEAIGLWVAQLERTGKVSPSTYLFMSRQGENKPLTRLQAWRNLKRAFKQAGLIGPGLATHSLRKSYCAVLHEKLGRDIVKLARAMGHKNISSTAHYLSFKDEEIDQAILTT